MRIIAIDSEPIDADEKALKSLRQSERVRKVVENLQSDLRGVQNPWLE